MILALGIEHPLDMTVQRSHDANPRHHRVAAAAAQQVRDDVKPKISSVILNARIAAGKTCP
jgi:hypothetical protein